jgi:hypothetical protein
MGLEARKPVFPGFRRNFARRSAKSLGICVIASTIMG